MSRINCTRNENGAARCDGCDEYLGTYEVVPHDAEDCIKNLHERVKRLERTGATQ